MSKLRLPSSKAALVAALFLIGVTGYFAVPMAYDELRVRLAIHDCRAGTNDSTNINCIFGVIDNELHRSGPPAAMHVFSIAYESYPAFANGGCHARAHRVGDMLYYEIYLGSESLDSIEFPQSATACGYGLFHGFMEHYVQDHPTPAAVTAVCTYLIDRLGKDMHDIEPICYHGAGHGFTLAQTALVSRSHWGDLSAFTTAPAKNCRSMASTTPGDIEQCYEGIFNIVDEYMTAHQYGFSYNTKSPLKVCTTVPAALHYACVYEMSQNLDSVTGQNPLNLPAIVGVLQNDTERQLAFNIAISSMIQQIVDNGDDYRVVLERCAQLSDEYFKTCVQGIAAGLFEHGDPQNEYKKAMDFCGNRLISEKNEAGPCYQSLIQKLWRFYSANRYQEICGELPAPYAAICKRWDGAPPPLH